MWARIESNKVIEIIDFNPEGHFTDEIVQQFLECPDDIQQNMRYIDSEWLEPEIFLPTIEEIRAQRNQLLSESDWTQVLDSPLLEEKLEEWATYRQELRDFPEVVNLNNVVWPIKPN